MLLSFTFLAGTCNQPNAHTLDGKWTMRSFIAFRPNIPEFKEGDIIWKIDTKTNRISVMLKNPKAHKNIGLPTGSYDFKINDDKLKVAEREYFYRFNEEGVLTLDQNTNPHLSKDLPVMTFKKMK